MSVRIIEGSIVRPANSSTHLDVFPPVLVAAFGARWFENGCLSVFFRHAVAEGEPVRACIVTDDIGTAAVSLITTDGTVVVEGTASVGAHSDPTALGCHEIDHDPVGLRILVEIEKGDVIGPQTTHCPSRAQSERIFRGQVASPLEWYHGPSPWGQSVAAPSTAMRMFTDVAHEFLLPRISAAVGVWGAMELHFHGTPIVCDTDYMVTGEVLAVGQTPSKETLWYDLAATDEYGDLVATARVLTRFAKSSSPLYHARV